MKNPNEKQINVFVPLVEYQELRSHLLRNNVKFKEWLSASIRLANQEERVILAAANEEVSGSNN